MAKFLSLNFIKGEKPHHEHTEGGGLMKIGYILMVSVLFVLLYAIFTTHETEEFVSAGFATVSFAVGLAALVAYLFGLFKPQIRALSRLGTFFSDRMYLPFLNDYIMPKIGFAVSDAVQDYGNRGIDGFFNTKVIPGFFGNVSTRIRSIQTGYLDRYVNIVLGVVMAILIAVAIGGVLL
jgi:NADH-quinone oxidoreductase subunit L